MITKIAFLILEELIVYEITQFKDFNKFLTFCPVINILYLMYLINNDNNEIGRVQYDSRRSKRLCI